jgi:hypothetical protein
VGDLGIGTGKVGVKEVSCYIIGYGKAMSCHLSLLEAGAVLSVCLVSNSMRPSCLPPVQVLGVCNLLVVHLGIAGWSNRFMERGD